MKQNTTQNQGQAGQPVMAAAGEGAVETKGRRKGSVEAALDVWLINRRRIEEKLAQFGHGPEQSVLLAVIGGGR